MFTEDRDAAHRGERGVGLVVLMLTVLLLGGLAAVALTSLPTTRSESPRGLTSSVSALAQQKDSGQITAAAQQACFANYAALQMAVSAYQVIRGSLPTSAVQLRTYFKGTLATSAFTLTIDPVRPGQVQVATGGHPSADGDGNCRYAG